MEDKEASYNYPDKSDREVVQTFLNVYNDSGVYMWTIGEFDVILHYFLYVSRDLKKYKYALKLARIYYPKEDIFIYYAGKYHQYKHNYKTAIKYYKQYLYMNKDNAYIIFDIATCWTRLRDKSLPVSFIKDYLNNYNPFSSDGWFSLGVIYINKEEWDNAIDAFKTSIAINSKNPSAYFNLGYIYSELDMYKKAIEFYHKAIEYEDGDVLTIFYCLGEAYMMEFELEQAIKCFTQCISLDPEYADAYYSLAHLYYLMGEGKKALPYIERAIKINDEDPEYFSMKATIYNVKENFEEAEKAYLKAIALAPKNMNYNKAYLILLINNERSAEALEILNENFIEEINADINTDNVETNFMYFAAVYFSGRKQEAYKLFVEIYNSGCFTKKMLDDFPKLFLDENIVSQL